MSTVTAQTCPNWITHREAQRRLMIGRRAWNGLINRGLLTSRHVPGSWPVVPENEVERLLESFTTPARTAGSAA
jgi:hypothetical protein